MIDKITAEERFWAKVEPEPNSGCLLWMGYLDRDGYGRFWFDGRNPFAHRWIYERERELIPDGLQLDHLCRVHSCVNSKHLEIVTCRENLLRGNTAAALGLRKVICSHGHPFDNENTYWHPNGTRKCKTCTRLSMARFREKDRGKYNKYMREWMRRNYISKADKEK